MSSLPLCHVHWSACATNFSACWWISVEFDSKTDASKRTKFPQSWWKQTARLMWGTFYHTPSEKLDFLNVHLREKYLCENLLLNERIQKSRVFINTTITGKPSLEAFTSADSGVKGLKVTNPLAVFAFELVKTLVKGKVFFFYFNSLHSRSKQGMEIFTVVSWSMTCGLIALPNRICLFGINITMENSSRREDKRNCCQIMISECFL